MPASRPLSAAFLAAVSDPDAGAIAAGDAAPAASDRLEAGLTAALAVGRAAWPELAVDAAVACGFFGARAAQPIDPDRPLGSLGVADLYLACACSTGDPRALAACDELLRREATIAADATRIQPAVRDEAIQIARTLLFMPRPERPPAIHDFAGRGPLRGWLRVMVSREMLRVAKQQNRTVELEDELIDATELGDDPAFEHIKATYRGELADAFRAALAALPARDRTVLRYQMVDGLSIDEIGAIYRVHRATAARWLVKVRDELVERTRALLAERLGVDTVEAASIVRLVQSQLEVSVARHLRG